MLNNPAVGFMTLKKTVTLAAEAAAITINTDGNGNAFSLKSAELRIYVPALSVAASVLVRYNSITSANYYTGATVTGTYNILGIAHTLFMTLISKITCIGGDVNAFSWHQLSSSTPTGSSGTYYGCLHGQSVLALSALYLFLSTAANFPIGTVIELWGVDA